MGKSLDSFEEAASDGEKVLLAAIEKLLHVATGRCPAGDINEILMRLVRRATSMSPPYESDFPKLATAIWCVLVSKDVFEKLGIGGTTTGISGESTRFEFVRQYATAFVFETPSVEYCSHHLSENISACFEETLIGLAALGRLDFGAFSFFEALPILISFCRALNSRLDTVCETFLLVLSTIEKESH
jgi:hypothetical protein